MKKILIGLAVLLVYTSAFAAKQTVLSTDTGAQTRSKLNANFTELYTADGLKADISCFADASAFNSCFDLDWPTGFDVTGDYTVTGSWDFSGATVTGIGVSGDDLGGATALDVTALFSGSGEYLKADGSTGTPSGGAVDSVNGQTGTVVLDADDIDDTNTTNKFVTSTDLINLGNLSGTNTGDQDLSGYLTSATAASTYQPLMGADDNYVTDAEKVILGNTSGINTGDQDLSGYLSKTNTTEYIPTTDYHPATKKYVDDAVTAGGGYTDEAAQDAWGALLSGGTQTGISVTYNDAGGTANFVVSESDPVFMAWDKSTGISITKSQVSDFGSYAPPLGADDNYVTDAEKAKIAGIAEGAEVNVNADWNSSSGDSQILNKPTIPTVSTAAYNTSTWDASTSAPDQNALRDYLVNFDTDGDGDFTDEAWFPTGSLMTYPSAGIPNSTGSAWGTSYTFDTDLSSVSASDDSIPSAKATKTALDLKANAINISFVAAALSDLKYDPDTGTADDEYNLITNTGSVGDANDATVVPTLERAGALFQAKDANMITWPSAVSATEVGYLDGVTSAIQTQLNDKSATDHTHTGVYEPAGVTESDISDLGTAVYLKTAIDTQGEVETIWGSNLTNTIASGTASMGTSEIADDACATVVTVSATGVATTDIINMGFNGTPVGVTGYDPTGTPLNIIAYPTANNVNFLVCNSTGAAVTPGALTINWRVDR